MPVAGGLFYQVSNKDAAGSSLPLALIHGAGGMHLSWPPEMRRLTGRRVFALDLPGHGNSTGGCPSIGEYASAALAWLDALGLQKVILSGHSMGGAIALQIALDAPGRVAGLFLVGSSARLQVNPRLLKSISYPETFPAAVEKIIEWSFSRDAPQRLKELAARRMLETPRTVVYNDFLACSNFDIQARLGVINMPALVLCGEEDMMTPPAEAQRLAEGLPNGWLEMIAGAGHMAMLEQPRVVAARLADFRSRHSLR